MHRPQLGQEIDLTPSYRRPRAFKSSVPARTSLSGGAVRDIRTVSPIPRSRSVPMPAADFIMTSVLRARLSYPEVEGILQISAQRPVRLLVSGTFEAFTDMQISSKSNLFSISTRRRRHITHGLRRSAAVFLEELVLYAPAVYADAYWQVLQPARSVTAVTRSSPPMFPGLMRILSAPASADSMASL